MILNQFKGALTRWCDKNNHGHFKWHGKFHDHVIRDAEEYERMKNYIINNPKNWNK